jgi:hypothetical protein
VQVLGPTDKAQSTMVAAWLTELLLDQINRDLLAAAGQHTPDYLQHVEQLRWVLRSVLMAAVALMRPWLPFGWRNTSCGKLCDCSCNWYAGVSV